MNISIIGPEGSGKSSLATTIAKRVCFGRPIVFIGKMKSEFPSEPLESFHRGNGVVKIIDDANAVLESIDVYRADLNLKDPIIMSRHRNRVNIFIFHSFDDAVKFFFRQSRFMYVSDQYRDAAYTANKYIKGIEPELMGHPKFLFWKYKRY